MALPFLLHYILSLGLTITVYLVGSSVVRTVKLWALMYFMRFRNSGLFFVPPSKLFDLFHAFLLVHRLISLPILLYPNQKGSSTAVFRPDRSHSAWIFPEMVWYISGRRSRKLPQLKRNSRMASRSNSWSRTHS